jgi:antitoxin component HigA of HigAB toxin-antitoxin module
MAIEPIKNDTDHKAALARVQAIWNAEPGSPEFFELEALATLIEHYEDKRWPARATAPLEALKFAMEQQGYGQADLASLLGSRSRASEVMNGKRQLTLDQIRKVARAWRVPAALLIGELEPEAA